MDNIDFNKYKDLVELHILDFLPEIDHKSITVYEAMKYSLTAGGKRLRPSLLLAACEFAGGDIKNAIPYACAAEYIQTYSLIHDDLPAMDNDDMRRGLPTNHKVFGEATAILAGDGLLTSAFEAMKKEMLDYININKTAALIVASIRAGAHLGGANEKMLRNLTDYAEFLGLAFQIKDDILDVTGVEKDMGKKSGGDKNKNKSTYPGCYGLEASISRLKELTENAIAVLEPYYDEAEFFTKLANELLVRIK